MDSWKDTPKPAMTGTKPAMTGTKPAMTASKPSTSPAKPAGGSCCQPSSTAKKPMTKKERRAVSACYRRAGAALVAPAGTFGRWRTGRPDPNRDRTFELCASEVADPRPGDQFMLGSETFVVQGEPERRDSARLVWSLNLRPA